MGTRRKRGDTRIHEAIEDNTYRICNQNIKTYSYDIKKNLRVGSKKFTPKKSQIFDVNLHEGRYHPICKFEDYPDFNITESKIFKGKKLIYESKDVDRGFINMLNLAAIITCQYHSLNKRLNYDKVNMRGIVDGPHIKAANYTINLIESHLERFYDSTRGSDEYEDFFQCVYGDLIRIFGPLNNYRNEYELLERRKIERDISARAARAGRPAAIVRVPSPRRLFEPD